MTNTPIQLTTDLNQVLVQINEKLDKIDDIRVELAEIKGQIGTIDARLKNLETAGAKIPDLAEKVGELKNWKQIGLTLSGAIIGGFITYLVRTSGNP